ncbi:hypothetical protein BN000_01487 [Mycobacterium europaeum]|uniref:Uncharacterized protein n=1 Tax=Mycobacterium europaeum TaxID=761804 RepID=A0A0U1D3M6_9MYCO|nr:hypothetical protein BN000_01487 [Mycobacterium europaeum]
MSLSACPLLSTTPPDMSVRPPPFKGADKRTDMYIRRAENQQKSGGNRR